MIKQKYIVQVGVLLFSVFSSVQSFGLSLSSSSASSSVSSCGFSSSSSSSSSSNSSVPATSLQCAISSSHVYGDTYYTTMDLTNDGSAPIVAWNVQLNLAEGHSVTNHWNASMNQNDFPVRLGNTPWNGNLQPGQSLTFGVIGIHPGTFVEPECIASAGMNQLPILNAQVLNLGGTISVDLRGSVDPEFNKLKYSIDFGDGKKIDHYEAWHTYRASGNYDVVVSVSDGESTVSMVKNVDVVAGLPGNRAPIAKLSLDSSNSKIVAKATGSFDEDGDALTYEWIIGDSGSFDSSARVEAQANEYTNVILTVSDGVMADTVQAGIDAGCGVHVDWGSVANFTHSIDGLTVMVDGRDSSQVEGYSWNFGDGSALATDMITSHTYAEPGEYTITLTTRSAWFSNSKSVVVQLSDDANNPPQLELPTCEEKLLAENNYITECRAGTANDPDGDELTILWEMGDGKSYTPASITEVINHQYDVAGEYDITTTVSDGELSVSRTLSVYSNGKNTTPVNTPPVACFEVWINAIFPPPLYGTYRADCSTDADGDPLTYLWTFNDGTTKTGASITRHYTTPGVYSTTLTVSDGKTSTSITQNQQFGSDRTPPAVCSYEVTGEWSTGFGGKIVIHNLSNAPIDGWSLNWNYSGTDRINSFWNANIVGTNPYTASHVSWNKIIAPGSKVEIGFQGTKTSGAAGKPRVSGAVCR